MPYEEMLPERFRGVNERLDEPLDDAAVRTTEAKISMPTRHATANASAAGERTGLHVRAGNAPQA